MGMLINAGLTFFGTIVFMRVQSELTVYRHVPALNRRNCTDEDVVFITDVLTVVECSLLCLYHEGCVGVFHSILDKTCIGCRRYYNDICDLEETGSNVQAFYENSTIPDPVYKTMKKESNYLSCNPRNTDDSAVTPPPSEDSTPSEDGTTTPPEDSTIIIITPSSTYDPILYTTLNDLYYRFF